MPVSAAAASAPTELDSGAGQIFVHAPLFVVIGLVFRISGNGALPPRCAAFRRRQVWDTRSSTRYTRYAALLVLLEHFAAFVRSRDAGGQYENRRILRGKCGIPNENGPSFDGPGCTPPRGFEPLSPI